MNKTLIESLKTIKETCHKNKSNCFECPLKTYDGMCLFDTIMTPDEIKLKDLKEIHYK